MATEQQTFEFMAIRPDRAKASRLAKSAVSTAPLQGLAAGRDWAVHSAGLAAASAAPNIPQPTIQQPPAQLPSNHRPSDQQTSNQPLDDREDVLRRLRSKVGCISTAPQTHLQATFSTGSSAIDRLLPAEGLRGDAITEWVAEAEGSGAASLALLAASVHLKSSLSGGGPLVVVSDQEHFYPPAAISLGIPAHRIIWVRPANREDLIWSIDQSLRCEAVGAVWAALGANLDDRDARRFQLAAEEGRTAGLFLRPAATRHRPSFAEVRFHVGNASSMSQPAGGLQVSTDTKFSADTSDEGSPSQRSPSWHQSSPSWHQGSPRLLQVTLDRCRGGQLGKSVWVEILDQGEIRSVGPQRVGSAPAAISATRQIPGQHQGLAINEKAALHLASELAHPKTAARRAKRA